MAYEAILYDMDGVVIDTHKCAYAVLSESASRFGVDISAEEIRCLGSLSGEQFWTLVKGKHHLSESIDELVASYDFEREMSLYDEIGLLPDVESVLLSLRESGHKVGLVTSAKQIRVAKVLSLFENTDLFDVIVTADEVREHKPSPSCYLAALDKLGIKPNKALAVEDSSNGALAAKAAGCDVVGYVGSMWEYDQFEAGSYITDHLQLLVKVRKCG